MINDYLFYTKYEVEKNKKTTQYSLRLLMTSSPPED